MNSVTLDERKAPWNDKEYHVKYRLCIDVDDLTFKSNWIIITFITSGEKKSEDELEMEAKMAIMEEHKDLYSSDMCPDYIDIYQIYES